VFTNFLFLCSAALTLGGAFAVLWVEDLMHACIYLLASLFGVAGLYACIGADFLAATQLVVYAGGVVILMLFAVMLTGGSANKINKFGLEKIPGMGNGKTKFVAGASAFVMAVVLLKIMVGVLKAQPSTTLLQNELSVEKLGTLLATDHILAFEISSVLLLGALIGAAIISRPRKEIHD
jgi:NADH-quinone oxidoreductase subunit J